MTGLDSNLFQEGLALVMPAADGSRSDSALIEVAREVSAILRDHDLPGAIVGGIATVLHGHLRTTGDLDVCVANTDELRPLLEAAGFKFVPEQREFIRDGIPIHLVTSRHLSVSASDIVEIEGVRTITLAALLNAKLRSGSENPLRPQDLADVIGLMRVHGLRSAYASRIAPDLRPAYRTLATALEREAADAGNPEAD